MAETSTASVQLMFEGTIPSDVLVQKIADAKLVVEDDGFSVSDSKFEILQRYYAAHLLEATGYMPKVSSDRVADVAMTYAVSQSKTGESSFLHEYNRISGSDVGLGINII